MNLALFDFDGTITRGDTFSSFVRFAGYGMWDVGCGMRDAGFRVRLRASP
jgi:hypothetical protein